MRLVKYLAHSGVASRRAAERIIAAGRVRLDGETVTDPARDVSEQARVEVDGRPVGVEPREVWMLNKPPGVVSTARDPGGRPTVVEMVRSDRRLYPVGRLDADSRGLLLLTNDGSLAERLLHPRYGVLKTYRVRLARPIGPRPIEALREGVDLDDGLARAAAVRRLGPKELEIDLGEGRKRQVRRMVEAVGHRVADLQRTRFGPLALGRLPEGKARRLRAEEIGKLWQDARPMRRQKART